VPSLDLRFADNKSLVDAVTGQQLVTFTRASSGTFVDSAGTLQTAATNVPRFDHNPATGESLGLLVEEARTNLLLRSEEFDNASWAKVGSTVTANTGTAPDGAATADLLTRTTTGVSYATQTLTKAASAIQYTFTVFAKQSVGNFCALRVQGTYPSRVDVVFNLSSATVSTAATVFGSFTGPSASITPYANGWYRLTVTGTSDAVVALQVLTSFNSNGTVADGTDSVSNSAGLLWGAQLEAGAFPTSYIPTTTATVTRAADVVSITSSAFSSFYRADEGTMFADVTVLSTAKTNQVISIDDGTTNNRIELRVVGAATAILHNMTAGGVAQNNGSITVGSDPRRVVALSYRSGDARLQSGVIGTTFTGATVPTVTQIQLNKATFANGEINGTIRRFTFWTQRLPNPTPQSITL
jgi:hypothetical protein